jgi:hypothetical protein
MRQFVVLLALSLSLAGCWGGGASYRSVPAPTPIHSPVPGLPDHDGDISQRDLG